jgi:phage FluMu protein Com
MLLFGIEAESPDRELLSFECPQCQNIETRSIKSESATSAAAPTLIRHHAVGNCVPAAAGVPKP